MGRQFRQGDVLVEFIEAKGDPGEAQKPEGGRVILAHGEVTGHAHAISAKDATLFVKGVLRKLKVQRATQLLHEEHAPIPLSRGHYEVTRQREYTLEAIRDVAD